MKAIFLILLFIYGGTFPIGNLQLPFSLSNHPDTKSCQIVFYLVPWTIFWFNFFKVIFKDLRYSAIWAASINDFCYAMLIFHITITSYILSLLYFIPIFLCRSLQFVSFLLILGTVCWVLSIRNPEGCQPGLTAIVLNNYTKLSVQQERLGWNQLLLH